MGRQNLLRNSKTEDRALGLSRVARFENPRYAGARDAASTIGQLDLHVGDGLSAWEGRRAPWGMASRAFWRRLTTTRRRVVA